MKSLDFGEEKKKRITVKIDNCEKNEKKKKKDAPSQNDE